MATMPIEGIRPSVTGCVGNTPLVRLVPLAEGCVATVAAKLESLNPLWSVKDRIGRAMIDAAERDGLIRADTVIIEPTSGNTGIGLAFVCAARGYRLVVTMPESMSLERRRMLKALGAELILTPAAEGMPGAVRSGRGAGGPEPQLLHAAAVQEPGQSRRSIAAPRPRRSGATRTGRVDMVVAGVGTGGTITGVGEVLKARKPGVQDRGRRAGQQPGDRPAAGRRGAAAGQAHDPGHRRRLHSRRAQPGRSSTTWCRSTTKTPWKPPGNWPGAKG